MTEEFLDAFVREAEESIVELNNALLALEDDPTDEAAMDGVFRTAHTLKGNCSAMGFDDTSRLAHAIEDLLDEVRSGTLDVTPDVMDPVFDGVDTIETALDQIEAESEASIDPDPIVDELRSTIDEGAGEGASAGGSTTASEDADSDAASGDDPSAVNEALSAVDADALAELDPPLVHVRTRIGDSDMPSVDGTLVLESAGDSLDVVAAVPGKDAIGDGEFDEAFDLFVAGVDPEHAETVVAGASPVRDASATDVTDAIGGEPDETDGADAAPGTEGDDVASTNEIKSVRIDVEQLDELYGLVEQLVTSRIKLRRAVEDENLAGTKETIDELDKISSSLQGTVMDIRLIPLEKVVNTFPRMVRDLAREQGKEIDFAMENTDVELDRTILDRLSDPLMHVLRNAVDHGVESPEEREAKGKPRQGTVRLRARRERDYVEIEVEDDGGGLDVDAIREKAIERDVRTAAELDAAPDEEIYELIFHPGFSTSDEVTDVSGRGVGMDVVASTVDDLDGSVSVDSAIDEGTTVALSLPVSVAIVQVLFIEVAGREYGLPIKTVDEVGRFSEPRTINGKEAIEHDDAVYPLVRLREALGVDGATSNGDGRLLRIEAEERQVALVCDAVDRIEEVVIKPLEGKLADVSGLSGTSVVGDGNVVPIIDVGSL